MSGCQEQPGNREGFLCRDHWSKVSKETRDRVWRLYRTARFSAEHMAALRDAIKEAGRAALATTR